MLYLYSNNLSFPLVFVWKSTPPIQREGRVLLSVPVYEWPMRSKEKFLKVNASKSKRKTRFMWSACGWIIRSNEARAKKIWWYSVLAFVQSALGWMAIAAIRHRVYHEVDGSPTVHKSIDRVRKKGSKQKQLNNTNSKKTKSLHAQQQRNYKCRKQNHMYAQHHHQHQLQHKKQQNNNDSFVKYRRSYQTPTASRVTHQDGVYDLYSYEERRSCASSRFHP